MRLSSKVLLIASIVIFIAGSVFGGSQAESDVIKIGVAGAHSGDLASYGLPSVKAAELVVADWNANGGLLGKQIELVVEDDVCDPKISPDVATKLIGTGAVGVIGHICSGATESALSIYNESKIVTISPSATNPPLTQSGSYPNFYRTISTDWHQAKLITEFALNELKLTKIAVLHDKQSYGKGLADLAKGFIDESPAAEVVLFEGIQADAVDYSAVINKVANSGAQAIVYGGYHPEASKLVTLIKEKNLNLIFISDDGVKDNTFIEIAKAAAEGVYASGPNDTTQLPMAVKAKNDHVAKYKEEPGAFFYNAYAATQALLTAIKNAGSTDYEAVRKALTSNFVDTVLGSISFDERGDVIGAGFTMYQVRNGVYVQAD